LIKGLSVFSQLKCSPFWRTWKTF